MVIYDELPCLVCKSFRKLVVAGQSQKDEKAKVHFTVVRYDLTGGGESGILDKTFGGTGKVIVSDLGVIATAVAAQPDGRIVVGGYQLSSSGTNLVLVRFNSDGTLDPAFGVAGKVITKAGSVSFVLTSLVIQPDGKILVGGSSFTETSIESFTLARFDSKGVLDPGFGVGGKAVIPFDLFSRVRAIALQGDGKVVAAGEKEAKKEFDPLDFDQKTHFTLIRLNKDGGLDKTFGPAKDGKVITDFGDPTSAAMGVAIQKDGRIVAAGYVTPKGLERQVALVRYDEFGNLDPGFGIGGKVMTPVPGGSAKASSVALFPPTPGKSGRIVVGGTASSIGNYLLARYCSGEPKIVSPSWMTPSQNDLPVLSYSKSDPVGIGLPITISLPFVPFEKPSPESVPLCVRATGGNSMVFEKATDSSSSWRVSLIKESCTPEGLPPPEMTLMAEGVMTYLQNVPAAGTTLDNGSCVTLPGSSAIRIDLAYTNGENQGVTSLFGQSGSLVARFGKDLRWINGMGVEKESCFVHDSTGNSRGQERTTTDGVGTSLSHAEFFLGSVKTTPAGGPNLPVTTIKMSGKVASCLVGQETPVQQACSPENEIQTLVESLILLNGQGQWSNHRIESRRPGEMTLNFTTDESGVVSTSGDIVSGLFDMVNGSKIADYFADRNLQDGGMTVTLVPLDQGQFP